MEEILCYQNIQPNSCLIGLFDVVRVRVKRDMENGIFVKHWFYMFCTNLCYS
ncbi:hypothetical protein DAPPUDRAFT_262235 [Daphnia pulex]|uniref:Uncharacterized protein n=1 Tax=Daphnia pulex TaxID=6669 RepID=E9HMM0_DAPPU|nr:hypothetical protein DAPPUDRAFT_262235 [Daphnia pulex]|eukprot:EFX67017.1 hypothetical protein DAPPUDRAFT_262235 [Daphnia pulex]